MARVAAFALSFALFLAAVDFGSCLRCYQCNSQADGSCSDPYVTGNNNRHLVDCSSPQAVEYNRQNLRNIFQDFVGDGVTGSQRSCHKIVFQSGTVVRTCLDMNAADPNHTCRLLESSHQGGPGQQIKSCRFCDSDACNSSVSMRSSVYVGALSALLALLINYLV